MVKKGDVAFISTGDEGIVLDVSDELCHIATFTGDVVQVPCQQVNKINLSFVKDFHIEEDEIKASATDEDGKMVTAKAEYPSGNILHGLCLAAYNISLWPNVGDEYWRIVGISTNITVEKKIWRKGNLAQKKSLDSGGIFKTRKAAEEACEKIKAVYAANLEAIK